VFLRHVDWEMIIDVYETPNAVLFKQNRHILDCMALKLEVLCSSGMKYRSTWTNVLEDSDHHQHCCEDIKSPIYKGHILEAQEVSHVLLRI
jgi:hypothetical protein